MYYLVCDVKMHCWKQYYARFDQYEYERSYKHCLLPALQNFAMSIAGLCWIVSAADAQQSNNRQTCPAPASNGLDATIFHIQAHEARLNRSRRIWCLTRSLEHRYDRVTLSVRVKADSLCKTHWRGGNPEALRKGYVGSKTNYDLLVWF